MGNRICVAGKELLKGVTAMPITDILERNCKLYGNDICLV